MPSEAYQTPTAATLAAVGNMEEEDGANALLPTQPLIDPKLNECVLLWQGILPKRTYSGLKFQEFKTSGAARRALSLRNAEHYWDMAEASRSKSATVGV